MESLNSDHGSDAASSSSTAASIKNSPFFSGKKDEYDTWLKKLGLWLRTTDIEPEKRALIIAQRLGGLAQEAVLELDQDELATEKRWTLLTD